MNDYLLLLQGYYKFLLLGKFFEDQAKQASLSVAENLEVKTGEKTRFTLKATHLADLLLEIHKHPEAKNVYGYLTEVSAFRGIFSIMREMIEKLPSFRAYLQQLFGEEYVAFEQVIRFLRNVLSHSTTPSLLIHLADFDKQKDFLISQKIKKLNLNFIYADHLKERKGSADYACKVSLDLFKIEPLTPLDQVISLHQRYLLAELCFNVTQIILMRTKKLTAKTSSTPAFSVNPKITTKTKASTTSTPQATKKLNLTSASKTASLIVPR